MPDRLYSEAEVQALLRQAADRQRRLGPTDHAHGLTLAEVEAIAAEAGLDPAHVRAAARLGPDEEVKRWLGAPRQVRRRRTVEGPLTEEAWVDVVQDLRRTFEEDGTATQLGGTREWKAKPKNEPIRAVAEAVPEGWRLAIEQDYGKALNGLLGGAIGMGVTPLMLIIGMLATGDTDPWPAALLFTLAALVFLFLPPVLYKRKAERQAERFEAVLDRAERAALQVRVAEASVQPEQAQLDLDALDGAEEKSDTRTRTRARS